MYMLQLIAFQIVLCFIKLCFKSTEWIILKNGMELPLVAPVNLISAPLFLPTPSSPLVLSIGKITTKSSLENIYLNAQVSIQANNLIEYR